MLVCYKFCQLPKLSASTPEQHKANHHCYLLVQFEGVTEGVQSPGLVRVHFSQGGGAEFQEVLIIAHLCNRHAVELI